MAGWFRLLVTVIALAALSRPGVMLPEPARRWRVPLAGRGEPATTGDGSVVFLTANHEVVSVRVADGVVRWRARTDEPGESTLGSRVLLQGGIAIAGDYNLVAFDIASGTPRWRFAPDIGYGPGLYLGAGDGALAFAGSPAGRLYAVRTVDGSLAWTTASVASGDATVFEPVTDGTMVGAGFTVFGAPVSGGVVVVDAATGRERWRRTFPVVSAEAGTGFAGGPVLAGETIVAAAGDGSIYGFDLSTGAIRWRLPPVQRPDGRRQVRDWRALVVAGDLLVAGSASGVVSAWDVATRRSLWTFAHPLGGSTAMRLGSSGRQVFVPHLNGLLVAVDARTGQLVWQTGGGEDGFSWVPASARGLVFAGARAGLFALVPGGHE
jgi:outer membrane protein assembly factor BamB